MPAPRDDEYQLAALWHHVLPLCAEVESLCPKCGETLTLVPPEELYYICASCHPESHTAHL